MRSSLLAIALIGCGTSEDAATVELPVTTGAAAMAPAVTDLGYEVRIDRMRIAITAVQFTIEGEQHGVAARVAGGGKPHPGHSAGGEVTGELPGDFVLAWTGQPQPVLGNATFVVGDYRGANFAFRAADARDALPAGDPLIGHTFHIAGTVAKGGTTAPFDAVLDVEADAAVIGAVFEDTVTEASRETLAFAFYPTDLNEGDTPFDGIEFFALPAPIEIRPGSDPHNILRRAIQTHDHYGVIPQ